MSDLNFSFMANKVGQLCGPYWSG